MQRVVPAVPSCALGARGAHLGREWLWRLLWATMFLSRVGENSLVYVLQVASVIQGTTMTATPGSSEVAGRGPRAWRKGGKASKPRVLGEQGHAHAALRIQDGLRTQKGHL